MTLGTGRFEGVRPRFLVLFGSIYAVQGVTVAYLFNFNKPYMQAWGVSVEDIGSVQTLALLPMAFKFLVGPLSDRFNVLGFGRRLPYIVVGLAAQAMGLAGLALIDPRGNLAGFGGLAVLTVVGLAFYDTSCDGLVMDVTPAGARARVQSLLWGSRFVSATVFTLLYGGWLGWLGGARYADRLLLASAALTMIPVGLAFSVREPVARSAEGGFAWSALRVMGRPWSLALLAFGGIYGLAGMGVESNLSMHYTAMGLGNGGDVGMLGASPRLAASTFALFMAVTNLSVVGDKLFAEGVMASGGYEGPFVVAGVATLAALPLAWPLSRKGPGVESAIREGGT